jgi:hypothetical protein
VRDAQVGTRLVSDGLSRHRLPAGLAERVQDAGGERRGDRVTGTRVATATEGRRDSERRIPSGEDDPGEHRRVPGTSTAPGGGLHRGVAAEGLLDRSLEPATTTSPGASGPSS